MVLKYWVHRQGPCPVSLNTKYFFQFDGIVKAVMQGSTSLLLQPINGSNARHDAIRNIHQHAGDKEQSRQTQERHNSHQMNQNGRKHTIFIVAEEIVQSKYNQGERASNPCVYQEENEVFCTRREVRHVKGKGKETCVDAKHATQNPLTEVSGPTQLFIQGQ